jgi:hypothetical protein
MKRKVIYVSFTRLTDKVSDDWHIDFLVSRGVTVEYWDVVSVVREEHSERGSMNPDYLRVFRSIAEIERELCIPANQGAFYVMLIPYSAQYARLFRLFSKFDCRMLTFASGALPRDPVYKWRKFSAWLGNPHSLVRELANRSKAAALRKLQLVKPFAIAFVAGDTLMASNLNASRVVPINFFDYDRYVKARNDSGTRVVAARYALFLDSNLPYHTDLAICGLRRIDPVSYFRSLNRFFDLLERKTGIAVVIAVHPRADYDSKIFGGRQIYRFRTAELARDAEFVLSHTSTAMSYAVLNCKPLAFIYTDGMADAYEDNFIREMRCFADYLDAPIYNVDVDDTANSFALKNVNLESYKRYKYGFLTSNQSENTSTQEIFWREINA